MQNRSNHNDVGSLCSCFEQRSLEPILAFQTLLRRCGLLLLL